MADSVEKRMAELEEWWAWRRSLIQGVSSTSSGKSQQARYQIMQDIEQWRDLFGESRFRDLIVLYRFSPEWECLWGRLWAEFDDLDNRCRLLRVPEGWKQGVSEYREVEERRNQLIGSSRKGLLDVAPPAGSNLPSYACPLSACLRRLQGLDNSTNPGREYSWRATLSDWEVFRGLFNHGGQDIGILSTAERSSYQVLQEWWCSTYSSPHLITAVRDFISKHEDISIADEEYFPYTVEEDDDILNETLCRESLYHSRCFQLWVAEFNPLKWEPFVPLSHTSTIERVRSDAINQATLQRLGYACLYQGYPPLPHDYNHAVKDQYIPWLDDQRPKSPPYYLWDVTGCCTVTVSELPSVPQYTCISHTWGRWRLNSSDSIPGVPWPVPRNSLYNVRILPDMFFQLGVQYVWFDLFCIPQDGSRIADIEIGRQTEIFRGAHTCVAWFHDITSWASVSYALDWIGLRFLTSTTTFRYPGVDYSSRLRHAEEGAVQSWPELVKILPQPEGSDKPRLQPASWFSSLWTLQEAVLCPDMKLCSQNWDTLTDRRGNPLTLAVFCGLLSEFNAVCVGDWSDGPSQDSMEDLYPLPWSENPPPEGTKELVQVLTQTHLRWALETRSPMTVLMTALARQCTSDREPAIMSAIGITDWYNKRLSRGIRPQDGTHHKVLGLYDLEFVREAARKFGAGFYFGEVWDISRLAGNDGNDTSNERNIGSMLPFSAFVRLGESAARGEGGMLDPARLRKDHPAVAGWEVRPNGAVRISVAGILASSAEEYPVSSLKMSAMTWWATKDPRQPPVTSDFERSLRDMARCGDKDQPPDSIYAVSLFTDFQWQYGIILQSPHCEADRVRPRRFVKIGKYVLHSIRTGQNVHDIQTMPKATVVDWLVV